MEGEIAKRVELLAEIHNDEGFPGLSADDQTFVNDRLKEYGDYQGFRDGVAARAVPASGLTIPDLRGRLEGLERTVPPAEYAKEWAETSAVKERKQQITTITNLLDRTRPEIEAANQRAAEYDALAAEKLSPAWAKRVTDQLAKPAADPTGKLADVEEVALALRQRREAELRLKHLRDMAAALGLTTDPESPAAVLVIPDLSKVMVGRLAALAERAERLKKLYPDFETWDLIKLPVTHQKALAERMRQARDRLEAEGQTIILQKLALMKADTIEDWRALMPWLKGPEFAPWRELYGVVAKSVVPKLPDPVEDLASFVAKDRFDLTIKSVRVTIPDGLKTKPLIPTSGFRLYAGEPLRAFEFPQVGQPIVGGDQRIYFFEPKEPWSLMYNPGQGMFADLDLNSGGVPWVLTWARSRSSLFQTEKPKREPRLHRPDQKPNEGESLTNIDVLITGDWPTVPILVPVVRVP